MKGFVTLLLVLGSNVFDDFFSLELHPFLGDNLCPCSCRTRSRGAQLVELALGVDDAAISVTEQKQ